jgi:hypothetical protein
VIGSLAPQARSHAGYTWLNSLPPGQAVSCLVAAGLEPGLAADVASQRPLTSAWLTYSRRQQYAEADLTALASVLEGRTSPPSAADESG